MTVRMSKPWASLSRENIAGLGAHMGVYEVQDSSEHTVFIGYAGGKSLFGLRGELERELGRLGTGHRFRCEVNTQYMTRYKELLMVHQADLGELPRDNRDSAPRLGRLRPE
ncbi:MAG: hypothetical protein LAP38_18640 [Acidobacteriia bacterium]|nr:hypothetical protein [Terriglobia bacterium]